MNREQAVEKMKHKLDQWNHDLDALESRADQINAEKRGEYQQVVTSLREKRAAARAELERLRGASDAAFDDMRAGMERAWDKVAESFQQAKARYH